MTLKEEFKIVRRNALANPNLYNGRYTDKDYQKAYAQYLEDTLQLLNKITNRLH